jgi:hypothetical protein
MQAMPRRGYPRAIPIYVDALKPTLVYQLVTVIVSPNHREAKFNQDSGLASSCAGIAVVVVDVSRILDAQIAAIQNGANDRSAIIGQPLSGVS